MRLKRRTEMAVGQPTISFISAVVGPEGTFPWATHLMEVAARRSVGRLPEGGQAEKVQDPTALALKSGTAAMATAGSQEVSGAKRLGQRA